MGQSACMATIYARIRAKLFVGVKGVIEITGVKPYVLPEIFGYSQNLVTIFHKVLSNFRNSAL